MRKQDLYDLYTVYGRKDIDLIIDMARDNPNSPALLDKAYSMFGRQGISVLEHLGLITGGIQ